MLEWGNKEVVRKVIIINTKIQPKGPRERAITKEHGGEFLYFHTEGKLVQISLNDEWL